MIGAMSYIVLRNVQLKSQVFDQGRSISPETRPCALGGDTCFVGIELLQDAVRRLHLSDAFGLPHASVLGEKQALRLVQRMNFRHADRVKPVRDRYRSCLIRSWRARAVGMFLAARVAAISTSACRA